MENCFPLQLPLQVNASETDFELAISNDTDQILC